MVGGLTKEQFKDMLHRKVIPNCNILTEAVTQAHTIFGLDIAGLRGKATWKKPRVVKKSIVMIPKQVVEPNKLMWIAGDVMFVNG